MFLNWVRSCDRHGIEVRDRAVIFAMDKQSRDLALGERFQVIYDENSELLAVTATAMRARLSLLLEAGWRPLVPVIAATLASFMAAQTSA